MGKFPLGVPLVHYETSYFKKFAMILTMKQLLILLRQNHACLTKVRGIKHSKTIAITKLESLEMFRKSFQRYRIQRSGQYLSSNKRLFKYSTANIHISKIFPLFYIFLQSSGILKIKSCSFTGCTLTLFRMRGVKKALITSFSSITSTNVGLSPQNFVIFTFIFFATLV